MPLFLSEDEFRGLSHDATLVAEKADVFIRELYHQLENVKAEADAAAITAEQTCSVIELKYVSLSAEFSSLQSLHSELNISLGKRDSELGQLQSEKQHLLLQIIEKDGEIERLNMEVSEVHKSKRQLMEMLGQKDLELSEKNAGMKSYLDKIVNLTEIGAAKEARLGDLESESVQLRATCTRFLQEKELIERHNSWLNEELTAKVDSLMQLRKANGEFEVDMSSKLADAESKYKESSESLKVHKDILGDLEVRLSLMEEEVLSTKDAAAVAEQRFSAEISTVSKLVELYKESSDEWSKKAGELEGAIKALETHLDQVVSEYKEKLEKEKSARNQVEKESADLKEKLQNSEVDMESLRKEKELKLLPLSSFTTNLWMNSVDTNEMVDNEQAIVPSIPVGVSGTALAASLLRDGWSLAKMYVKYQEAADALRHEQLGRRQAQAILERVLYEIEEKAGIIMDEREEHERLVEAYAALDQKFQQSLSEYSAMETDVLELKANLKRQERDYDVAQKEIVDLQKQVAVLLKECRDVQLRCGSVSHDNMMINVPVQMNAESNAENIISSQLLTFKDINGLVEHSSQLRSLVHNLSDQIKEKEAELKEKYEIELQKLTDETASKVNAVLLRAEEQGHMIESLHTSVAMYRKLYEQEHRLRASDHLRNETAPEHGSSKVMTLQESSPETSNKIQEQAYEQVKKLDEELSKSRGDLISIRAENDKLVLEAQFAQEKLARYMKEFEHQREEHNGLISRNVEFSQLIVDYQKKLRESSDSSNASSDLSRKLTMEVSLLKHEKEILQNSEKRAFDEVRSLSERVHRLQASLDTIQSTEDAREEARSVERRKQEEYIKKLEREWVEVKRELQEERDNVRSLALERESTLKDAFRQVEESSKELTRALQSVAAAESRAAAAEARCSNLEKIMEPSGTKDSGIAEGGPFPPTEKKIVENFKAEIEKIRSEAQASEDHMLQYKSIAQVNEAALKQMESAYEQFRTEAYDARQSLEMELHSLKERVVELENECKLKTEEAIYASAGKEEALLNSLFEISSLKEDCSVKMSQIVVMESQISALKEDLEKERQRWRSAQTNYERQVILQSETIQELTKTSQALASSQEEVYELRKMADVLRTENNELKLKWETEKLALETSKNEADRRYKEVNELNMILHSRLEALHIKSAENLRGKASGSSSQTYADDDGLQNVVNYLRRSKEIAETEISLLKQEKLRLQSQLDSALTSSQAAQSSLQLERTKSRASLLTDEEFKSLQLQVRELTLLRESNTQLREEYRHTFEKWQKLGEDFQNARSETENLEKLLQIKETDLECCKREINDLKMEKMHVEQRINELLEKYGNVDDYNQIKESFQLIQLNLREKDAQMEEIKKFLSEKQDAVLHLEQDLTLSRTELNERETKISEYLQSEMTLKSEVEKVRRANAIVKRKVDNLSKEKENLSKELQALTKQLDEARQAKRNLGESASEQALREKEKEKDTRIQSLERALEKHREELKKEKEDHHKEKERYREELKKEKEDHHKEKERHIEELKKEKEDHHKEKERNQKTRKTIVDSRDIVIQQKIKLSDELNKHKQALKALQDEVEKLKSSENAAAVQHISSTLLDDLSSEYFQAVTNFELTAQPVCNEPESSSIVDVQSLDNTSTVGAHIGQPVASSTQTPATPATNIAFRTVEEKERRPLSVSAKANVKTGRKLVRPNIIKPREPQGDVYMPEADEPNPVLSSNTETQGNITLPTTVLVRKRPSASFPSDMQEEMLATEETNTDMAAPMLKKSKSSDGDEGKFAATSELFEAVITEESSDDVVNLIKQESVNDEREELENLRGRVDEPMVDEQIQDELPSDAREVAVEKLNKPSDTVQSHDQFRDQIEQDIQQVVTESGFEREEGELVAEFADNDDSYISNEMEFPGVGEHQAEQSIETENSPVIESFIPAPLEVGEIDTSQTPEEEENDVVDTIENIVESSNKDNDGVDPVAETDQFSGDVNSSEEASTSTIVDIGTPEQDVPTLSQDTGGKPVSPLNSSSTTINLQERAKQRAHLRQAGMLTPLPNRARGRAVRGRGVRGGRTARGPQPG